MLTDEQRTALMGPIPTSAVKQRKGAGGMMLDHVTGEYVMRRLLEILGPDGWSTSFVTPPMVVSTIEAGGSYVVTASSCVRLTAAGVSKEDVGVHVATSRSVGDAIEFALKSCATDAFKRAARQWGNAVGLALYDKDQVNVIDDSVSPPLKPAPRARAAKPAPEPSVAVKSIGALMDAMTADNISEVYLMLARAEGLTAKEFDTLRLKFRDTRIAKGITWAPPKTNGAANGAEVIHGS